MIYQITVTESIAFDDNIKIYKALFIQSLLSRNNCFL